MPTNFFLMSQTNRITSVVHIVKRLIDDMPTGDTLKSDYMDLYQAILIEFSIPIHLLDSDSLLLHESYEKLAVVATKMLNAILESRDVKASTADNGVHVLTELNGQYLPNKLLQFSPR